MPGFDLLSPDFFANPYPTLAEMRAVAPCWFDPKLDAHVITRFHDIDRVLGDHLAFSSVRVAQFGQRAPAEVQDLLRTCNAELERWLLFRDPPGHTELRKKLRRVFGASVLRVAQEHSDATIDASLDLIESKDAPDVVRDFAYPVPTRLLALALGVETEDIDRFKGWTVDLFALIGAGIADEEAVRIGHRGVVGLRGYVLELIRDRRERPRQDAISALVEYRDEEGALDDADIIGLCMTMIVAGHETTTNLIANALHAVFADDRARAWIIGRGRVPDDAVDEFIRYDGSVFSLIRRAQTDVTIADCPIRSGEYVFSILNAGNRDARAFDQPDRLNLARPRPSHLGFGVGIHACLGAAMARAVGGRAIGRFVARFPDAAAQSGCVRHHNMSIRGLARFPVQLHGRHVAKRSVLPAAGGGDLLSQFRHAAPSLDVEEVSPASLVDVAETRPRRVTALVRPRSREEVELLVRAANACGAPIYPISTGRSWGIGSRKPIVDDCILVDLHRMDGIKRLDLESGYAVVEPGVSQGAIADRLDGTPFMLNVTTGCRDASLLGNTFDRGEGILRSRVDDLLGAEVVLGDGTVVTTGGAGPVEQRHYHALAAGPDVTRMFCQSSFGVVTSAVIGLLRRPARTIFVSARFARSGLRDVVDAVVRLRREGVLRSTVRLADLNFTPEHAEGSEAFQFVGPLMGPDRIVREAEAIVREELARLPTCIDFRTGDATEVTPADPMHTYARLVRGIPDCEMLRARFGTKSCDLDRESRWGWSMITASSPADGASVCEIAALLPPIVRATMVPRVALDVSLLSARYINLMVPVWFERTQEGIDQMRRTRSSLEAALAGQLFYSHRDSIDSQLSAEATRDAWAHHLKRALDPNGIIAPGRYS